MKCSKVGGPFPQRSRHKKPTLATKKPKPPAQKRYTKLLRQPTKKNSLQKRLKRANFSSVAPNSSLRILTLRDWPANSCCLGFTVGVLVDFSSCVGGGGGGGGCKSLAVFGWCFFFGRFWKKQWWEELFGPSCWVVFSAWFATSVGFKIHDANHFEWNMPASWQIHELMYAGKLLGWFKHYRGTKLLHLLH